MGGQFQDLIIKVSGQLQGVERILAEIQRTLRDQGQDGDQSRERIAALEKDLEWIAEARRQVDGRLQTGDQTFKLLEAKIATAQQTAKAALDQLQRKETTSRRKKWTEKALEAAIPSIVTLVMGLIWWSLYHLLLVGPKIAEAMKKTGGQP
jgi:chromosome segregation ATPase